MHIQRILVGLAVFLFVIQSAEAKPRADIGPRECPAHVPHIPYRLEEGRWYLPYNTLGHYKRKRCYMSSLERHGGYLYETIRIVRPKLDREEEFFSRLTEYPHDLGRVFGETRQANHVGKWVYPGYSWVIDAAEDGSWYAWYYCNQFAGKLNIEGVEIRARSTSVDPQILERVKARLEAIGLERFNDTLYAMNYEDCDSYYLP